MRTEYSRSGKIYFETIRNTGKNLLWVKTNLDSQTLGLRSVLDHLCSDFLMTENLIANYQI